MKRFGFLFLSFLLFFTAEIKAQVPPVLFDQLRDNSDQPITDVTCIFRDHSGFMWFGTIDGLYRYDGRNTIIFRNDPKDSSSIAGSLTWNLTEDSKGTLWISTSGGMCSYNPHTQTFHRIYPVEKGDGGITAAYVDADDVLWFGARKGLCEYNIAKKTMNIYSVFDNAPNGIRKIPAHAITQIGEQGKFLWMTTGQGLCRFEKATKQWTYFRNPYAADSLAALKNSLQRFCFAEDGSLWIGSWGDGLLHFDPSSGKFETHSLTGHLDFPGRENMVFDVMPDSFYHHTERLWVASFDKGLGLYDIKSGAFSYFGYTLTEKPDSIFTSQCKCLFDDRKGTLWIGTSSGIYKINRFRQRFRLNKSPLISNSAASFINCFAENKQNNAVYLGTFDGGVVEWNRKENNYTTIPGLDYETTGEINDLKMNVEGKLLVASDKGTFAYSPELGKTEILKGLDGTFTQIIPGEGKMIFLFCRKAGALKYNLDTHQADTLISAKEQWSQHIFSALQDDDGSFWLGTFISGITHCTANGKLITTFTSPETGGPIYNIFSVTKDRSGTIWFSSNQGLIEMKAGATIPKLYTTADGLPSNFIYFLCCDKKGNLWLNTNHGLSLRDAGTKSFRNFSRQDGLLFEALTTGSLVLADGTILCGEEHGFLSFDPEKSTDNVIPPPVIFTSVKLMGKEAGFVFSDTVLVHELSYDNNQLTFEFAALNFIFPERNRYQYKLDGVDNSWISADYTHNSASYSALPPGNYIFYVKACNNDGVWNEKGIRYRFTIHPPFWETWWFRILSFLIVSAVVYSIYRYRIKQIVKLERMRNKIASDLHDDIGSALSSISIYSEIVSQKSGTEDRNSKMIEQIGETSREMLENMNDIVWTINPKNDRFGNVLQRMKNFGNAMLGPLEIDFVFHADDDLDDMQLSMEQRKNFYLIFKEAINNTAKYSSAKSCEVLISFENKILKMKIRDDGKGFVVNGAGQGNGLENMKKRAEDLNGSLTISSEPGKGTKVYLQFKTTGSGS